MLKKILLMLAVPCSVVWLTVSAQAVVFLDAGESYTLPHSDFYDSTGNNIPVNLSINSSYFTSSGTQITRGADYLANMTITNGEFVITAATTNLPAMPNTPNVTIQNLQITATRSLLVDGETVVRAGTNYKYDGTIQLAVGHQNTIVVGNASSSSSNDTSSSSSTASGNSSSASISSITLYTGDVQYLQCASNEGYKDFTIKYADIATATTRLYDGQASAFGYSNDLPSPILNKNRTAFMHSINITVDQLVSPMTVYFDKAYENYYIYKNDNGNLTLSNATWNSDLQEWSDRLTSSTHYIISDIPLVSAPYTIAGQQADDDKNTTDTNANADTQTPPDISETADPDKNYNPNTGSKKIFYKN